MMMMTTTLHRGRSHARRISIALALGLTIAGAARADDTKEEARTLPPFTEIAVEGALRCEVAVGGAQSVKVSAEEKLLPRVRTEVQAGRLRLYPEPGLRPAQPIVIRVSVPQLLALTAGGASTASLQGLTGPALRLTASGASRLEAAGQVEALAVELSGASQLAGNRLKSARLTLRESGASRAELSATESVAAHLSGASSATVRGGPKKVDKHLSGASQLDVQ